MGIFENPVDIVFFGAILASIVLFVVLFFVSKFIQKQRDKKYEAEFEARKQKEALVAANEELKKKITE